MKKVGIVILMLIFFVAFTCEPVEPQENVRAYAQAIPEPPQGEVVLWGTEKLTAPVNKEDKDSEFTEQEILLLERVTMSEASTEPFEGKVAVAKTILNRAKMYNMSIEQVVYQPYQYSFADNGKPSEEVKRAVTQAINDTEYPDTMIYFREGGYHSFGVPYIVIGRHYFSLKEVIK